MMSLRKKRLQCLTLALLSFLFAVSEKSGGNATAQLPVQVTVPPTLDYKIIKETSFLSIKAKDIERGYKDVKTGTIISVSTNSINGYALSIYCQNGGFFTSVRISVDSDSYLVSPDGAVDIYYPYNGSHSGIVQVSYRFYLSSEAKATHYASPIGITVHAL
jgi:hypothetical protein